MRTAEQQLWDTMKRNAPADFWLQRIENGVAVGMPDVFAAAKDATWQHWIELKAPKRPARATTKLLAKYGVSQNQINWHLKAAIYEISSWILIRDSVGALFLIPGKHAWACNDWDAVDMATNSFADTWPRIFEALR